MPDPLQSARILDATDHGTTAGYQKCRRGTKRNGSPGACADCREAKRLYVANQRGSVASYGPQFDPVTVPGGEACTHLTVDPEWFFAVESYEEPDPNKRKQINSWRTRRAQKVCGGCDLRETCLQKNLDEEFGIWGGLTPLKRKQMSDTAAVEQSFFLLSM